MKTTLSSQVSITLIFIAAALMFSVQASSQLWTFRNGFGQTGATNALADVGRAVCTDASGNVYMTGKISDDLTANTVSFGGTALVSAGDDDGFVAKFNSAGVHQWSIRFGGTSFTDIGSGIATDGTSVFVTGAVNGAMTVGLSGTSYPGIGGGIDGFLMKLDAATGTTVSWVTRFGGANSDEGQAICLDPSGNIYISGYFRTRTGNPNATFGSFTRTVQGNYATYSHDLFAAQLNPTTGAFNWVSTGGSAGGNDNVSGSGICYIPSLNEVIVTGCYRSLSTIPGSTTATYSTTSPVSSVTLTNANVTTNEDFCLLEIAAATGAFVSGSGVGAGDGNEAGLGITYDSFSGDVFFAGYFSSASTVFPGNPALTNPSPAHDNAIYGRYNPTTNAYTWVKDANNGTSGTAADVARSITTNGSGGIIMTGNFRNAVTFPNAGAGLVLTASGAMGDIFVVRVSAVNGNADYATQGVGTNLSADDIGYGIAASTAGNVWITGQYASSVTFSPLASLASTGDKEDIVLAKFTDAPTITTHPSALTDCNALPASFTVVASGSGLTYQWQEDDNSGFSSPTVLTNTGVYTNTGTATLTITDNTGLTGRYYRAVVSNAGGSATSNGALLTVTPPTMPSSNTLSVHVVNTANNYWYGAGCALVGRVIPSGATPISGNTAFEVWIESSVLTYAGQPYVQRHYQVTPSAGSTGTVTLYFTQIEFDNFNAHPSSVLNLPTNAGDAAGIANMRISKFNGSTNNGTGLPGSYTSGGTLLNPVDANVVFNATFSRWEVTVDVSGFSGFFVQTFTSVLPVNLISFAAQRANNDIQLKWQTEMEVNNDRFEVERSLDGRTFTTIGHRAGINGTGVKNYDWVDAGAAFLSTSKIYYRLKIVSTSGSSQYSNTVVVYLNKSSIGITGVMPNPFRDKLNVNLNLPTSGQVVMSLTDFTGRIIHKEYAQGPKGFSTHTLTGLEKITAGVYVLSVEFDGQLYTYKVNK